MLELVPSPTPFGQRRKGKKKRDQLRYSDILVPRISKRREGKGGKKRGLAPVPQATPILLCANPNTTVHTRVEKKRRGKKKKSLVSGLLPESGRLKWL